MKNEKLAQRFYKKAIALINEGDHENAEYFMAKAFNKGSKPAQLQVGLRNLRAKDSSREVIENALKLIKSLGGNGYAKAYFELGNFYCNGNYLPKDLEKAAEFTELAAEQGHIKAQSNLGAFYAQGLGIEKDFDKAMYWSKRAAEQGNSEAQNNLGGFYAQGIGVEKNITKAIYWLELAANQGNESSQNTLGRLYADGEEIEKDYKKALDWFKKASDSGHLNAQTSLAWMYQSGLGVEANIKTSLNYWRLAERQGDLVAKLRLAEAYMFGDDGPIDKVRGFKLVEEAASAGNSQAIFNLGICYAAGMGVDVNRSEAINYIQKAADQNLPDALYVMGNIYQNGFGEIKPDYELAIHWLERAVKHGYTEAEKVLYEKVLSDLQDQGSVVTQIGTPAISDAVFEQTLMKLMRNATPSQFNLAQTMVFKDESVKHVFDRSIEELIATDETQEIEFKQTFNTPTKTEDEGKPPTTNMVRYWALREIAGFLNSNDGTLLIGVIDGMNNPPTCVPIISGIEHDKKGSDSLDKYGLNITNLAKDAFGATAAKCINIKFEKIDAKTVCRIDCKKSSNPVHYTVKKIDEKNNGRKTFVRISTTTSEPKDMKEWEDWLRDHF